MDYDVYEEKKTGGAMRKLAAFLGKALHVGNRTMIEIYRNDNRITSVPLTIVVLLCIFLFKYTLLGLIVSLFFGVRYRLAGDSFNSDTVNSAMNAASNMAESIKENIKKY